MMKLSIACVVAVAVAVSGECDVSDISVKCSGQGLTQMPEKFHRQTARLDLSNNGIKSLVSAAWMNHPSRQRRAWTSTCDNSVTLADANYDSSQQSLSSYGDEDGTGAATDLTAVPGAAISCLTDLYELNLLGNAITEIPPLGTGGLGLVNLGIVIMEDNLIVSIPTNTFTGLTELSQISFKTNRIEVVPPALLSGFPKLFTVDFSDNRIKSVPVNLFGTDATTAKTYFAGNVLQCNAFDKNGAQGCTCNKAHAQYVSGASEFDDVDTANGGAISRVCRTGPTALSEIEALKVIMASLETKMTTIEGFGATIDTMATTTTNIAADLAQIHLKLDAAGCPQINRRFGRSAQ